MEQELSCRPGDRSWNRSRQQAKELARHLPASAFQQCRQLLQVLLILPGEVVSAPGAATAHLRAVAGEQTSARFSWETLGLNRECSPSDTTASSMGLPGACSVRSAVLW